MLLTSVGVEPVTSWSPVGWINLLLNSENTEKAVTWLVYPDDQVNIGIKHGFSCINIRQFQREMLKTEAGGRGFQHLPRDLANVNALKNRVWSLLLHKNWKHLLHFALFLALFFFIFSSMSHECNFLKTMLVLGPGSTHLVTAAKSVVPVRSYWKLRSRALTVHELPC